MGRPRKTDTETAELPAIFDVEENTEEFGDEQEEIHNVTDPDWTDYVMSLLAEDEKYDGNPTTDGLRRVAELLLGELVEGTAKVVAAPEGTENGRATVEYTVKFLSVHPNGADYMIKQFTDVADCWKYNSEDIFSKFPTATAATKAEGRALRKALKLKKVLAAEEIVSKDVLDSLKFPLPAVSIEDFNPESKITSEQIMCMDVICKRMEVNPWNFINSGSKNYANIKEVDFVVAKEMIKELNNYQAINGKEIPENVKGYNPNWKTEVNVKEN